MSLLIGTNDKKGDGGSIMDEISLRELIEIILKEKWIIAVFTGICILASGVVSFFVLEPVYEAQAILMITPITNSASRNTEGNAFFELVESLSQYPQMTIETYKEQVKTPVLLDYLRSEMGMSGTPLSTIAEKINVDVIKNTNLITITVKDEDPETAARMANLLSERFTNFVSETGQKQAENSAEFIKKQQEIEKANLDKALEELKNFLSQPRGPKELELELNSKLAQLTDFKTMAVQTRIDENAVKASLEHGRKILENTPVMLITSKTLVSDEFLAGIVKEKTGLETLDIAGLKLTEEQVSDIYLEAAKKVNKLEMELSKLSAQRQNIEKEIAARQKEIESLQAELAEKQQRYEMLSHNVELIRQTYDAYQQKYKESMIKQAAEVGKSSILVVSQAIPPIRPVEPNKTRNVAFAAILGFVLSVFAVFMKAYWKKTSNFLAGVQPANELGRMNEHVK